MDPRQPICLWLYPRFKLAWDLHDDSQSGATVIAISSCDAKLEAVKKLGAAYTINYEKPRTGTRKS